MFEWILSHDFGVFYLVSQVFALAALILNLFAVQRRKRIQLLKMDSVAAFCSVLHFLFLGAWTGAASKVVSLTRDIIATHETRKRKKSKILPIFFVILYIIIGLITFKTPLSILPMAAPIIYTMAIYLGDISKIRISAVFSTVLWLLYNIFVFSIVGMASDAIFIINDLCAIYRYRKKRRKRKKEAKVTSVI